MLSLLKKDLLLSRRAGLLYLLFVVFFLLVPAFGEASLSMVILAGTYGVTVNSIALEEKSRSGILLNSLPLKRSTIVLSKYVMVYGVALFVIAVKLLITAAAHAAGMAGVVGELKLTSVLGALLMVTVLYAINFPVIFKYGYLKSRFASMILYFVLFFGLVAVSNDGSAAVWLQERFSFLGNMSQMGILFTALLFSLVILAGSIAASIRFYTRREIA